MRRTIEDYLSETLSLIIAGCCNNNKVDCLAAETTVLSQIKAYHPSEQNI
jgi:hypothetical protein